MFFFLFLLPLLFALSFVAPSCTSPGGSCTTCNATNERTYSSNNTKSVSLPQPSNRTSYLVHVKMRKTKKIKKNTSLQKTNKQKKKTVCDLLILIVIHSYRVNPKPSPWMNDSTKVYELRLCLFLIL